MSEEVDVAAWRIARLHLVSEKAEDLLNVGRGEL